MNIIKAIYIISITSILFAFSQDKNTILWNENTKITWTNFEASPNNSVSYKALTESGIKIDVKAKGDTLTVILQAYFDKTQSWVKEKTSYLLTHEQMHFNITELWARKFRQKLKGKSFSVKTFQKELTALHRSIFNDSKTMQIQYDKDTQHSINTAEQEKWNKKIMDELNSLNSFTTTTVSCKLLK